MHLPDLGLGRVSPPPIGEAVHRPSYYKETQDSLFALCCIMNDRRAYHLLTERCGCADISFRSRCEDGEVGRVISDAHSWQIRGAIKQLWWRGLPILVWRGAVKGFPVTKLLMI
jgi:hypothetical protein